MAGEIPLGGAQRALHLRGRRPTTTPPFRLGSAQKLGRRTGRPDGAHVASGCGRTSNHVRRGRRPRGHPRRDASRRLSSRSNLDPSRTKIYVTMCCIPKAVCALHTRISTPHVSPQCKLPNPIPTLKRNKTPGKSTSRFEQ